MRNAEARALAELSAAPFSLRVASYNYDYFEGWMRSVQKWIRSDEAEELLRVIPTLGAALAAELAAGKQ